MNAPANIASTPAIGAPFGGGFFGGLIMLGGTAHAIVVAGKKEGEIEGCYGCYGTKIDGAGHFVDGLENTKAMAAAGSELAQQFLGLRIGGHEDWHLAARDVVEVLYRNFKPGADKNYCGYLDGYNANSVPPGELYTPESPAQTAAEAFRKGGDEAFDEIWYWTSTQCSAPSAFIQAFGDGLQYGDDKDVYYRARAVRLIPL